MSPSSLAPSPHTLEDAVDALGIRIEDVEQHGFFNAVEAALLKQPQAECPVQHFFIPGHYCRQITMPAGSLIVSKVHNTWHAYTVTKGFVSVVTDEQQMRVQHIRVGGEGEHFASLTEPGTRRLLFCHEETVWTTFHPTQMTDVDTIEDSIMLPNTNPLLLE